MAFFAGFTQITGSEQESAGWSFGPLVFDLMFDHFRVEFVAIDRLREHVVDYFVKAV